MSLAWYNIRTGETRVADDDSKIAAMWGSSDRGPNATVGQDFGWRLAPAVVLELNRLKQSPQALLDIARRFNLGIEDVNEQIILAYISSQTAPEDMQVADDTDYQREYDKEIRRLERQMAKVRKAQQADNAKKLGIEQPAE